MGISRDSVTYKRVVPETTIEGLNTQSKVWGVMESTMTELVKKFDNWIAQVTMKSLLAIMEILDNNHNPAFFRGDLKRAAGGVLILMVDYKDAKVVLRL